jgi:hypothetical protein
MNELVCWSHHRPTAAHFELWVGGGCPQRRQVAGLHKGKKTVTENLHAPPHDSRVLFAQKRTELCSSEFECQRHRRLGLLQQI